MIRASWFSGLSIFLLSTAPAFADTPIINGLAGAGRSGIPQESLFLNPGAIGMLQANTSFFDYTKPRIRDLNAGGRDFDVGTYDTQNSIAHAGLSYERDSRATLQSDGTQGYIDDTTVRFGAAVPLAEGLYIGATPRYVSRNIAGTTSKFVTGDVGAAFTLFGDLHAGLTYENVVDKPGERPKTVAGGLNYTLGYGATLYGDYGLANNTGGGSDLKIWSLAAELSLIGDFKFRGGLYRDGVLEQRGSAFGIGWSGPRASFDVSLRQTKGAPVSRDMTAGIKILM